MKATLTTDLISKMTLLKEYEPDKKYESWGPCSGPNYLVYDEHRDAPVGFAIRVGKNASVFLVEKLVNKKKMKIHVGLARGRKGGEKLMELSAARKKAFTLIDSAKKHGANPKKVAEDIEAAELTLGMIWDRYIKHLLTKSKPIKPNSLKSVNKGRDKFSDWEDRKVKHISADEITARFDFLFHEKKIKTAAEAACRWATAAVDHAIAIEVHNAQSQHREPSLTYNPFTILQTLEKYRTKEQLETEYTAKGIRNPMSFAETVGPFVKAAWEYRAANPMASDYLLIDLLWGLRGDECRTFKWRDQLTDAEAATTRWVDMKNREAFIYDGKNRGNHVFPIGPFAYEILKLRRNDQIEGTPWVFPARSSRSNSGHYSDPSRALNTVREKAGIKVVRGHDLRRTFGGACEVLGFTEKQTKRMLGHGYASGDVSNRYSKAEEAEVKARMAKVEELIMGTAPNVYNALLPAGMTKLANASQDVRVALGYKRPSRRKVA